MCMASATYLWAKILAHIEQKHTEALVTTWFDDVDVVEIRGDTLVVFTPNPFRKTILETQCIPYITEAMQALGQQRVKVEILDEDGLRAYRGRMQGSEDLDAIKKEFTFDNFVVGSSNRFAHGAALAVASKPADAYNPLLIYGQSGLGKTHLLYAIANALRASHERERKKFRIVYVKAEQFTNEMITSLREGKMVEFRSKFRTADLFLMDDIQFLARTEQTQEEFFNTFNHLYEAKKQIVLTSDKPPEYMNKLETRLKTRFQWGLLADIQPPDYETRVAIVEKKADSIGLKLPEDVVSYVAENVTSNVRQLEGTVNKIKAYRDINGMALTLPNVSRAIIDMIKEDKDSALPTPQKIIAEAAAYYNISESIIRGKTRNKITTEARQVSMYLIRKLTSLSFEDIASEYGKDHTTVMHAVEKIETNLPADSHLQTVVEEIQANINGKF